MRRTLFVAFTILATLVVVSLASAQSGQWDLNWFTIDGGGAISSTGDGFALSGTIGQPDTGSLSGGVYTLKGGFWGVMAGSGAPSSTVYLPLIRK
jgi:hypothetical protein